MKEERRGKSIMTPKFDVGDTVIYDCTERSIYVIKSVLGVKEYDNGFFYMCYEGIQICPEKSETTEELDEFYMTLLSKDSNNTEPQPERELYSADNKAIRDFLKEKRKFYEDKLKFIDDLIEEVTIRDIITNSPNKSIKIKIPVENGK